jgi:hypothetical protein
MYQFQKRRAHQNWGDRGAHGGFCSTAGWLEFFNSLPQLILNSYLDTGDLVLNITPMN